MVNDKKVREQFKRARNGELQAQSFVARMARDPDHEHQEEAEAIIKEVTSRGAQEVIDKLNDS